MSQPPKQRSADFKLKLALEAIKGDQSIAQLATNHDINPKQIIRWRDKLLEEGVNVFKDKRAKEHDDTSKEALLKIIEQHRIELEFLKKKLLRLQ